MTWLKEKAWPWLRKYWQWLLFPVGIIVGIAVYRPKPKVLAPELLGHADEKEKIEKRTAGEIVEAKEERDKRLAEIKKEHADTVAKLTIEQKGKLAGLRNDPDKVNEFLKQVGKDIRGG